MLSAILLLGAKYRPIPVIAIATKTTRRSRSTTPLRSTEAFIRPPPVGIFLYRASSSPHQRVYYEPNYNEGQEQES